MGEIKKVAAAIAFSDYSQGIVDYAAQMARAFDAELIVVNVVNSRDVEAIERIAAMGYDMDPGKYLREIKEDRAQQLEEILKKCPTRLEKVRSVFRVGNPTEELLKVVLSEDVDMIVMGIRAHSQIEHMIVGSVAERIFRRSPVAVVSLREGPVAEQLRHRIHLP